MIVVGEGSLLERALAAAHAAGVRVDYVFDRQGNAGAACARHGVPWKRTDRVNDEVGVFEKVSTDGVVLSVNNVQLFRPHLLSLPGFRFYNVHGGPIPKFRGRPEVCLMFAILLGVPSYGATLHVIDAGIDTGPTVAVQEFPVGETATFEAVMRSTLRACDELVRAHVAELVRGSVMPRVVSAEGSHLYTRKDLERLAHYAGDPALSRALHFGVFRPWLLETWSEAQRVANAAVLARS
jgi:methionyl-tRNA formyltransferase